MDASAVRYRELYGFLYPDAANVFHADLGRGMDFYFFGAARKWRLPKRDYSCGMYFKNGVPIGYVEVLWPRHPKGGRMEVGFNLYYTFRQGETAWLYARFLCRRSPFAALERWQMAYLPAFSAWAAMVILVFPIVFRYR